MLESYYRQFSTNIKIKILNPIPVLLANGLRILWVNKPGFNLTNLFQEEKNRLNLKPTRKLNVTMAAKMVDALRAQQMAEDSNLSAASGQDEVSFQLLGLYSLYLHIDEGNNRLLFSGY